jgi:hypothetical protein
MPKARRTRSSTVTDALVLPGGKILGNGVAIPPLVVPLSACLGGR